MMKTLHLMLNSQSITNLLYLSVCEQCTLLMLRFMCRLAEVRSNPNVLDIGIADFEVGDDVKAFRGGELSAADINKGRSHEDLLDI